MQALSDFANYVEKQQLRRPFPGRDAAPSDSGYGTGSTVTEDHPELDMLDSLGLSDGPAQARLKDLLLDTGDDAEVTLQQLSNVVQSRLLEGHGEALFDLGQDDNGESMQFSKEQWDVALDRIRRASKILKAECRLLITRNVGGEAEAETKNEKDKSCTGKLLIRQIPETTEDVIETRIAVVGNGGSCNDSPRIVAHNEQWTQAKAPCWEFWLREVSTMDVEKPESISFATSMRSRAVELAL